MIHSFSNLIQSQLQHNPGSKTTVSLFVTKMLRDTDNIMLHTCLLDVETIFVQHLFRSSTNSSCSIQVGYSVLRISMSFNLRNVVSGIDSDMLSNQYKTLALYLYSYFTYLQQGWAIYDIYIYRYHDVRLDNILDFGYHYKIGIIFVFSWF